MPAQVTNYQCPGCTGPLHFVGASGKLECDYCGAELRCRGDRGALCREGRKGCGSAACGRGKGRRKEGSLRRRRRLGYLRLQRGLGRGGGTHEGIQLPELRRGAALRRRARRPRPAPIAATPRSCRGSSAGELKPDFIVPFRLGKEDAVKALEGALQGKNSPAQSLYR